MDDATFAAAKSSLENTGSAIIHTHWSTEDETLKVTLLQLAEIVVTPKLPKT
jgi:hypothetical protein